MNYHDYHLRSYSVSDFGNTITLDLVCDYPNSPKDESKIEFTDVVAYHFIHTGGTIITEIDEIPVIELLEKVGDSLLEWSHQHGGLKFLNKDLSAYKTKLEGEGYKSWSIESVIGFEGFVIAKKVE
ncbi:MAG TPA: hypothetical protein VIK62_08430 [Verrucomicrobiae bacterium]